jgi:hypothetical protein
VHAGADTRSPRAVGRAAELTLAEAGIAELRLSRSTMRTRLTIMAIVLAADTGAPDTIALLAVVLGWLGLSDPSVAATT